MPRPLGVVAISPGRRRRPGNLGIIKMHAREAVKKSSFDRRSLECDNFLSLSLSTTHLYFIITQVHKTHLHEAVEVFCELGR